MLTFKIKCGKCPYKKCLNSHKTALVSKMNFVTNYKHEYKTVSNLDKDFTFYKNRVLYSVIAFDEHELAHLELHRD
jgi:hypothetical protein